MRRVIRFLSHFGGLDASGFILSPFCHRLKAELSVHYVHVYFIVSIAENNSTKKKRNDDIAKPGENRTSGNLVEEKPYICNESTN